MSSSNSPCAACKFLRRKCTQGCVFAPYFPSDNPQKFANVHRVFGASNVAKLLNELNLMQREEAVNSLAYEADARLRDPVYGCLGYVYLLQHKLGQIHHELEVAKKELASYIGPAGFGPAAFLPFGSFGNAVPPFYHQLQQQQQQQSHFLASTVTASTSVAPFGLQGMGLGLPSQQAQTLQLANPQQQQLAAAVREQELMSSFEQDLLRFDGGGGSGGGNSGLTLVSPTQSYDSNQFHMQTQQQQQPSLQIQYLEQQQQPQPQRSGSDEGRSRIGGGALSS